MEKTFKAFHYLSFLQYPFLLIAIYFCYEPIFQGIDDLQLDSVISSLKKGILFLGIGLSFTSLADIKRRTKLGDKIFGNPKIAKRWVIYLVILVIAVFALGFTFMLLDSKTAMQELSISIFVFGIGVLGLLRMNLEAIKYYQTDWPSE